MPYFYFQVFNNIVDVSDGLSFLEFLSLDKLKLVLQFMKLLNEFRLVSISFQYSPDHSVRDDHIVDELTQLCPH